MVAAAGEGHQRRIASPLPPEWDFYDFLWESFKLEVSSVKWDERAKGTQFGFVFSGHASMPILPKPTGANHLRLVWRGAKLGSFRTGGYLRSPLFQHSGIPTLCRLGKTKPIRRSGSSYLVARISWRRLRKTKPIRRSGERRGFRRDAGR